MRTEDLCQSHASGEPAREQESRTRHGNNTMQHQGKVADQRFCVMASGAAIMLLGATRR
jgi:hypothetical protein